VEAKFREMVHVGNGKDTPAWEQVKEAVVVNIVIGLFVSVSHHASANVLKWIIQRILRKRLSTRVRCLQ
jgi:hypothetical protein